MFQKALFLLLVVLSLSYGSVVAKINSKVITKEELIDAFNAYWREMIHLPITQATKRDMREFLIEYVRSQIIQQEAKRMGISVKESELKEYIQKNIGNEKLSEAVKELVKTELITNKIIDMIAKDIEVNDKEVIAYYYLNLRDFKLPAQVLVKRFLADDLDTANELYYRLSVGKSVENSKSVKEGEPMWYSIQTLPEIVKEQLYPYEVGKVSKPIDTGSGYLVLKIVDKRGGGIMPLESAKPLVRERLLKEKRQEVFREWFQKVSKNYRVEFFFWQL
jgi:parvulin-like peptidyl-prolyl isomerase